MLNPQFSMLKAFLRSPNREMYGRQIEKTAKASHERAVFYLAELSRKGILLREKKGKQVFYIPNRQSELAQKALSLAEMENKLEFIKRNESGFFVQDLVSQVAAECGPSIYFALLFGSTARGQAKAGSDLDLLFVLLGNGKTEKKIREIIKKRETISGKKISFHPISLKELEKSWLREPVYRNILDERIVFFGEENFWRFVFRNGVPE